MTKEELDKKIEDLEAHGYTKWTEAKHSTQTAFEMMKNFREQEYIIDYRVWDNTKYGLQGANAYGMDIVFVIGFDTRIDVEFTNMQKTIEEVEKIAADCNEFFKHVI